MVNNLENADKRHLRYNNIRTDIEVIFYVNICRTQLNARRNSRLVDL